MGKFNYKKAREEAERMLEVIEKDPQSTWENTVKDLVPLFYNLAIMSQSISISVGALKQVDISIFDSTKNSVSLLGGVDIPQSPINPTKSI